MLGLTNIKKSIRNILSVDIRNLLSTLENYDVISFDIFDTLVKRNVKQPSDVFKIVEDRIKELTPIEILDYKNKRIIAEKAARQALKETNSECEEITIFDIYQQLKKILFGEGTVITDADIEQIIDIEIKTEYEIVTPHIPMVNLIHQLKAKQKVIVLTSDMYLSKEVIVKILEKCGLDNYGSLYLSSDRKVTKRSGKLFEIILNDFKNHSIVHIGDNFRSDYLIPRKYGIHSFLINRNNNNVYFGNDRSSDFYIYNHLFSFINNNLTVDSDLAYRIGFEILGPMLVGFCHFLHLQFKNDKIDRYFFLSRDGRIIKDVYESLYPEELDKCVYFYASRKSLVIPILADARCYDDLITKLLPIMHVTSFDALCGICNLDKEELKTVFDQLGYSFSSDIFEVKEEHKEIIYKCIFDKQYDFFCEQKKLLLQYIDKSQMCGRVAVIDIGWNGSAQRLLSYFLKDDDSLYGYYYGVHNTAKEHFYAGLNRKGYLYNPNECNDIDERVRFTVSMLDIMFIYEEGSVDSYSDNGINHANIEYGEREIDIVRKIHEGAYNFVNKANDELINWATIFDGDTFKQWIVETYSKFALSPSKECLNYFSGFVIDEGVKVNIIAQKNLFYYLLHLKEFKRDFNSTVCKLWFIKSVVKINLPYFRILKFISKIGVKSDYRKKMNNL